MTIRRGYVDTNEGQVHYRSIESGTGTPVVLLHSVGSASAMYEGLMAELAGERPLYALDTPGYGGSAFPPPDPSAEDYARMLLAASAALGLDRFHCVGHHNGAAIACEMAASAPARVASAIFSGIPYLSTEELAEVEGSHAAVGAAGGRQPSDLYLEPAAKLPLRHASVGAQP